MRCTIPTDRIIDLLAQGMTVNEIASQTESKYTTIARRIERLRLREQCRTVTQLVVKMKERWDKYHVSVDEINC